MAQRPTTEEQAKDLFVRQLKDLGRRGAAPGSQARMTAVFAKHEAACREEDRRLEAEAKENSTMPPSLGV